MSDDNTACKPAREDVEKLVGNFEIFAKEQLAICDHVKRDRVKLGELFIEAFEAAEDGEYADLIGRLFLSISPILSDHIFMADWDPRKVTRKLRNLMDCLKRCKKNHPAGTKGRRWCNRMCFVYFTLCEL